MKDRQLKRKFVMLECVTDLTNEELKSLMQTALGSPSRQLTITQVSVNNASNVMPKQKADNANT